MAGRFVSIVVLMLLGPSAPLYSQGADSAVKNPAYLKDMPDPDRVLAEIHGSDEFDTAARRAAAMGLLSDVLLRLSPNWRAMRLTPDEKALNGRYSRAFSDACDVMNHLRNRSRGCNEFNPYLVNASLANASFRTEFLTRYLSPAAREQYENRVREDAEDLARRHREAERETERVARAFASVTTSPGSSHTCGLTSAGAAYCWGSNDYGQLGTGTTDDATTPTAVAGGLTFAKVSVGSQHTCAITTGGAAYCWGYIGGLETNQCPGPQCATSPVALEGGLKFASLSSGNAYTCAVTAAGAAYCWGSHDSDELGVGTLCEDNPAKCAPLTPAPVAGGLKFATVSAGPDHACGLTTTGRAYCWGSDASGKLGVGSVETPCSNPLFSCSMSPVPVAGVLRFASVSAGAATTCGVTTGGAAYCWGSNAYGQVGGQTTQGCTGIMTGRTPCAWSPVAVSGALRFATVIASGDHTCGLTTNGTLYCWGNVADLGAPATTRCSSGMCAAAPVAVPVGELKFASVNAASEHVCGMATTGATYCWGANRSGQLGNGTTEDSDHPTLVGGLSGTCERFGPAYNQDNACFDTRPAPLSTTSVTVPAGAPIPRAAILLVKVSSTGTTLETLVYVPSNVQTFNAQALGMARALRWLPAQKNGTPVEAWVLWRFEPIR